MKKHILLIVPYVSILLTACDGFLDAKPDSSLVVPENVADLESLLHNSNLFNTGPSLHLASSDDITTDEAGLNFFLEEERKAYLWQRDMFEGMVEVMDWSIGFRQMLTANIILEQGHKLTKNGEGSAALDAIMGAAYFHRAHATLNLLTLFAPAYDPLTAQRDRGVPIKLTADVQEPSAFSSMEASYTRMLEDLERAIEILPDITSYPTVPKKLAAVALSARVYLLMGNYGEGLVHAEEALSTDGALLDYNEINPDTPYPFGRFNREVIFHFHMMSNLFTAMQTTQAEPKLLSLYDQGDLRRALYFIERPNGAINFRGTYTGNYLMFSGIANDELYLIASECAVRSGELEKGLNYLNHLRSHRWSSGEFTELHTDDLETALEWILLERRKELSFRGHRWSDLKRLNRDARFAVVVERQVGEHLYVLEPQSDSYVFPIPSGEFDLE